MTTKNQQREHDIENLRVTIKVLERQRRPQELFVARRILHKMKSKTSVAAMPNVKAQRRGEASFAGADGSVLASG